MDTNNQRLINCQSLAYRIIDSRNHIDRQRGSRLLLEWRFHGFTICPLYTYSTYAVPTSILSPCCHGSARIYIFGCVIVKPVNLKFENFELLISPMNQPPQQKQNLGNPGTNPGAFREDMEYLCAGETSVAILWLFPS